MAELDSLWIDIANTAEVPFFKAILRDLEEEGYLIYITCWQRAEVPELLRSLGFQVKPILSDSSNPLKKALSVGLRTFLLTATAPKFDAVVTMENVMPLPSAYFRRKTSIIILDNDVKINAPQSLFQNLENKVKKLAKYILVPEVAYEEFSRFFGDDILTYPGYKEHVSISDYVPDPHFLEKIPFDEYIVLRPESLASHYVLEKKSIVPQLLRLFEQEGINVIYLPRNQAEKELIKDYTAYIPPKPLNGLDLAYYSKAVLTGSGTMAREATLLGVPAVSFFPGKMLLAIDKDLIEKGLFFHSREPETIFEYVISNWNRRRKPEFKRAKKVKKAIISNIKLIVSEKKGD